MAYRNFPKLNGSFINLRELSVNDAKLITSFMNYKIAKNLYDVLYPYTMKNAVDFIRSSHSDFNTFNAIHFAIEYKSVNDSLLFVGVIGLKGIDLVNRKASLGYWIGEEYWDKGIATAAVQLVISYAFSELGLEEIYAYVFPENKTSIRVLEKNGMNQIGEVNEYHIVSGIYRTSLKYMIRRCGKNYRMDHVS
jgi:[ribosomal protein S5]-alanine N-acetyltransferase